MAEVEVPPPLELVCAVYGEATVFPVTIARDAKVSTLQEAIFDKKRYKERYSFVASDLTLYLARKDGVWLKDDDNVKSFLRGDIDAEYKEMRPTYQLDEDYLGPKFQPGKKEIQVLVQLGPIKEETSSTYAKIASTLFQRTFLNVSSTTPSRTKDLKKQLVKDYQCDCGRNQNGDSMLLCMVMNIGLPSPVVIASHLFRREHDDLKGYVQLEDIDHVRNGLLLFKPIESAFDDLDVAFLVDKQDQFTLRIFNPTIKARLLVDRLTQQQWDVLGGGSLPAHWRKSTSPIYAPNAPQFNVLTTFGELDGKALCFPSGSTLRPFRRCLYYQAQLARAKAITQRWVPEDYDFDDFSSEGFTLDEKMKLLFSSNLSITGSPS